MRWQSAINAALGDVGLTHTQFFLLGALRWLSSRGAPPNQKDLADVAGTDPMTTSQVLRSLEARRLVVRRRDPADGRAFRVALTARGDALSRRAVLLVKDVEADFFAAAPDADGLREQLRSLVTAAGAARPLPLGDG